MIIDQQTLNLIAEKYGYCGSWAVWGEEGDTPKSNMGDLTVFNADILNPNIVFVGLNISRGMITETFANFHDSRGRATDFKTRYALKGTKYWGAYMTDVLKDFEELSSGKMMSYLRKNKQFELDNIKSFEQELVDIGAVNPLIIAFGNDAFNILTRNLGNDYTIVKIPHYANYCSKEEYRVQVLSILDAIP